MTKSALEMINDIDENLIESALEQPKRRKNTLTFGKLKWSVLAACLAIVMAVPAMAEVFGFTLAFNENYSSWNAETTARFAAEEYSDEVRNVKGQEYFTMQSMAEAENFLGINLPDNAVLEAAEPYFANVEYSRNGTNQKIHCDTYVGENEGNLLGTHTQAYYVIGEEFGGNFVNVVYSTVCEENPNENGGGFGYSTDTALGERESYVTPFGRECNIVSFDGEYDYEEMAVAEVNRVLVTVIVSGYEKDSVRETITAILDAYE